MGHSKEGKGKLFLLHSTSYFDSYRKMLNSQASNDQMGLCFADCKKPFCTVHLEKENTYNLVIAGLLSYKADKNDVSLLCSPKTPTLAHSTASLGNQPDLEVLFPKQPKPLSITKNLENFFVATFYNGAKSTEYFEILFISLYILTTFW